MPGAWSPCVPVPGDNMAGALPRCRVVLAREDAPNRGQVALSVFYWFLRSRSYTLSPAPSPANQRTPATLPANQTPPYLSPAPCTCSSAPEARFAELAPGPAFARQSSTLGR